MKIERVEGRTVLTGRVLDQSQLHGFARCLMDLGLELLSLERNPALEVSALHVESRFPGSKSAPMPPFMGERPARTGPRPPQRHSTTNDYGLGNGRKRALGVKRRSNG